MREISVKCGRAGDHASENALSVPQNVGELASLENGGDSFGEFESRSVKTRDTVEDFYMLENSLVLF